MAPTEQLHWNCTDTARFVTIHWLGILMLIKILALISRAQIDNRHRWPRASNCSTNQRLLTGQQLENVNEELRA